VTTQTETTTLHDSGFRLPAGVAAAIERANQLMANPGQAAPEGDTKPADAAPPAPPAEPTPEATPPVTPEVTPPASDPAKPVNWEHQYKSIKGRFDKSQEEVRQLTADIAELRRALAHAQATRPADPAPAAPLTAQFSTEDLTDEERNDYGEDLLKVVDKVAGRKIAQVVGAFEQKFGSLEQKVQGVAQVTQLSAKERFAQTLSDRVPNWRELNRDEGFLDWCEEIDQFSGQKRLDLLRNAYQSEDAPRCAAIFQGYLKVANPSAAPRSETTAAPKPSGKVPLESLAAPGRARSTAPDAGPGDKPIIARSEIEKFFSDVRRGVYRGRDAEKAAREAEIFVATQEGRVR
jgi:hypothetical protein